MRQPAQTSDPDVEQGSGVLDSIVARATAAARRLVSARDAHAGGTSAIVRAYQDMQAHAATLEASLAEAESRAASATAESTSLANDLEKARQDSARYLEAGHEALRQARMIQRERDASRESHAALLEEHNRLLASLEGGLPRPSGVDRRISASMPHESRSRVDVAPVPMDPAGGSAPAVAEPRAKEPFSGRPVRPAAAPAGDDGLEDEIRVELERSMRFRPGARPGAGDGVACLEENDRVSIAAAVDGFARLARARRPAAAAE